ncbi:hypothetical protein K469DRAFT_556975, partial [Zopfia rhizophila CBS 207.26]
PATIIDAMTFVRLMGKRYTWVNSVGARLIKNDKREQIAMMDLIYTCSHATIIALSSTSAFSGIPRGNKSVPVVNQGIFEIDGIKLASIMPTLRQQVG